MRVDAAQTDDLFQVRVQHGEEYAWVLVSKAEDGTLQITIQEHTLGQQRTTNHVLGEPD